MYPRLLCYSLLENLSIGQLSLGLGCHCLDSAKTLLHFKITTRDSTGIRASDYVKSPNSNRESQANPGRIPAYYFEISWSQATATPQFSG